MKTHVFLRYTSVMSDSIWAAQAEKALPSDSCDSPSSYRSVGRERPSLSVSWVWYVRQPITLSQERV